FAVASHGRDRARWPRSAALDRDWKLEAFVNVLTKLSPGPRSRWLAWFLHDLAHARSLRAALSDDALWTALADGTLFLCYHGFSRREASEFVSPVASFERQLEMLQRAGFRFLTAQTWADAWHNADPPRGRTAVVTIDDARDSVFELAGPVMSR